MAARRAVRPPTRCDTCSSNGNKEGGISILSCGSALWVMRAPSWMAQLPNQIEISHDRSEENNVDMIAVLGARPSFSQWRPAAMVAPDLLRSLHSLGALLSHGSRQSS
jgi:hypothetical protein